MPGVATTVRMSLQTWEGFISIEINENSPNENKQKLFFSEFTIARESASISCVWKRCKGRQGQGKTS